MTQDRQPVQTAPAWTLGWRLRRSLEHAGISVAEMAAEMGYQRNSLTRWMHDEVPPKAVILKQWALRCGVDPEWLETGEESSSAGEQHPPDGGSSCPREDSNLRHSVYNSVHSLYAVA